MLNQLIASNVEIVNHQVLAKNDPEMVAKTDHRLKSNFGFIIQGLEYVRGYLLTCLPEIKNLKKQYSKGLSQ